MNIDLSSFVNTQILFNPVNWLIVTLIIIFAAYSIYVITQNASSLLPSLPAVINS